LPKRMGEGLGWTVAAPKIGFGASGLVEVAGVIPVDDPVKVEKGVVDGKLTLEEAG